MYSYPNLSNLNERTNNQVQQMTYAANKINTHAHIVRMHRAHQCVKCRSVHMLNLTVVNSQMNYATTFSIDKMTNTGWNHRSVAM